MIFLTIDSWLFRKGCETWFITLRVSDRQSESDMDSIRNSCDILIGPPITMFHHSLMVSTQEGYDFCITTRLQSLHVNPLFCKLITSDWKSVMSVRGALSTRIACKMVASIAPLTVMVVEYFNCATNGGRVLLLLHQRLGIPPSLILAQSSVMVLSLNTDTSQESKRCLRCNETNTTNIQLLEICFSEVSALGKPRFELCCFHGHYSYIPEKIDIE